MSRRAAFEKSIGIFDMGIRTAEVFVSRTSRDAYFSFVDDSVKGRTKIVIGILNSKFREALSNAMHEAAELVFAEMGLRYSPQPEMGNDNGAYFFAFDHTKFSEAMTRVAIFINFLYPVLKKEHEKFHESKSNRRRKV